MQLPIPTPITISVTGRPYSLLEMAAYIVTKEGRYNRTAEGARSGQRLLSALHAGGSLKAEVADDDLRLFAEVVEKPSCGWGAHDVEIRMPSPTGERVMTRAVHAPTGEYLPLIDAVSNAAKSLPALPTK